VVIADNLGLLHGREGFTARSARHIQQVHIQASPVCLNPALAPEGGVMATILLAATATPGHVNPMLAAAGLLVAQGHRVLMLCGALFEQRIRATGAEFVPFAPEVDFDYRALERHFPERSLSGTAQMALALKRFFAAHGAARQPSAGADRGGGWICCWWRTASTACCRCCSRGTGGAFHPDAGSEPGLLLESGRHLLRPAHSSRAAPLPWRAALAR
jgi:hypothetical protein